MLSPPGTVTIACASVYVRACACVCLRSPTDVTPVSNGVGAGPNCFLFFLFLLITAKMFSMAHRLSRLVSSCAGMGTDSPRSSILSGRLPGRDQRLTHERAIHVFHGCFATGRNGFAASSSFHERRTAGRSDLSGGGSRTPTRRGGGDGGVGDSGGSGRGGSGGGGRINFRSETQRGGGAERSGERERKPQHFFPSRGRDFRDDADSSFSHSSSSSSSASASSASTGGAAFLSSRGLRPRGQLVYGTHAVLAVLREQRRKAVHTLYLSEADYDIVSMLLPSLSSGGDLHRGGGEAGNSLSKRGSAKQFAKHRTLLSIVTMAVQQGIKVLQASKQELNSMSDNR